MRKKMRAKVVVVNYLYVINCNSHKCYRCCTHINTQSNLIKYTHFFQAYSISKCLSLISNCFRAKAALMVYRSFHFPHSAHFLFNVNMVINISGIILRLSELSSCFVADTTKLTFIELF